MEKYVETEPEWILHKTDAGQPLFWQRHNSEDYSRVRFKYDVEIKEFKRSAHEMEDPAWEREMQVMTTLSVGMTCLFCIAVMILPWYIMVK